MMKWTKCAIRFLRISRPGVRVPSIAPRKTSTRCVLVFLFVCTMEGARTRRRRTAPQAISPGGCCLELRVAAPSIRLVPWAALASCWPLPQQLILASATGRSRRCCRFQWLGMSTVEAVDRKISWLFCFVSHGCTVAERVRLISRRFKTEKMEFHIDKTSRQVYNRTWKQQGIAAKSVRMPLWIETG